MLTAQGFRESFPLFTEEQFSTARVDFHLRLAGKQLNEERWGEWWLDGCYLHAAHHLTLEREAAKAKDGTGGISAAAGAVVSVSKTVGGVSKSESRAGVTATDNAAAGRWNLTVYGQQYWDLAQLVGAGGLQL